MDFKSYFNPNNMRILLALLLMPISLVIASLIFFIMSYIIVVIYPFNISPDIIMGVLLFITGAALAYFFGCVLDDSINSKRLKIIIALIFAVIGLLIIYEVIIFFNSLIE